MDSEVVVARIYIKEADQDQRHNLMKEIVTLLHEQHRVAGLTVFRGILGSGDSGEVHAADNILRVSANLPIVIEFFDRREVVDATIAIIKEQMPAHHIVSWAARLHG